MMPNKDGTGPKGKGPMTGRASGHCIVPLNTTDEEMNYLKNQEKVLKDQLKNVKTRLNALKTTACRSEK
jgi:hypothetical protein